MQSDGNLVVYTSSGRAVWMSGALRANQLNATTTSNYGMLQSGEYLHSASGRYQAGATTAMAGARAPTTVPSRL